jgi:hypothetical protein
VATGGQGRRPARGGENGLGSARTAASWRSWIRVRLRGGRRSCALATASGDSFVRSDKTTLDGVMSRRSPFVCRHLRPSACEDSSISSLRLLVPARRADHLGHRCPLPWPIRRHHRAVQPPKHQAHPAPLALTRAALATPGRSADDQISHYPVPPPAGSRHLTC